MIMIRSKKCRNNHLLRSIGPISHLSRHAQTYRHSISISSARRHLINGCLFIQLNILRADFEAFVLIFPDDGGIQFKKRRSQTGAGLGQERGEPSTADPAASSVVLYSREIIGLDGETGLTLARRNFFRATSPGNGVPASIQWSGCTRKCVDQPGHQLRTGVAARKSTQTRFLRSRARKNPFEKAGAARCCNPSIWA